MKRTKRLIAIIMAAVTVMACSISSFASVDTSGSSPRICIEDKTSEDVIFTKANQQFLISNLTTKNLQVCTVNGQCIATLYAFDGISIYSEVFSSPKDTYTKVTYKKNAKKVYIEDITDATLAAAQAQAQATAQAQAAPASAPDVKNTPAAQAAPAATNTTAGVPDLSNPEIKALWDQAVAIKAAYDAETNTKKKKELQKQFTAIMNQIPLN